MNRSQPRTKVETPLGTAALVSAIAHHQAGRFAEAEACYRQVLAAQPHHPEIHFNLGLALRQQGKIEAAIASYRETIAIAPNHADAHYNLGNALMAVGKFEDALAAYRLAIAIRPEFAEAHYNMGNALSGLDQRDEAVAAYRSAIAAKPEFAPAHYHLGNTLKEQGKIDAAIAAYRQALAIRPRWPEARSNLGNALAAAGRLDEAAAEQRQAVGIAPENAELHYNLGNVLKDQGKLGDAANAYRDALARKPDHAGAQLNLAIVLTAQGRLEDGVVAYRAAMRLAPGNADAHSNLLLSLHYLDTIAPDEIFTAHREWDENFGRCAVRIAAHANDRTPQRRLKIGYVSPDLREHSVAYFVEPLLRSHDRQAVEVFCYADVARPDAVTARIKTLADHWRDTLATSDAALCEMIVADRIDVLIDLAGHTAFNRLSAFARKPAPVQASWLGYPNTTGLSAIDYRLVDAVTDPPDAADILASECLLRLGDGFLCYGGARDAAGISDPPCLTNGFVTFGSFNNPAKLSPATLGIWAALLSKVPQARLLLKGKPFSDDATRALFLSRFGERGVTPERVTLEGWRAGSAAHLAQYARVDIALDPFPYNGTTTTCEALWMGVPVVTLRGDRHSGRVGASLLTQIGKTEWIADSIEAYAAVAAELAADAHRLQEIREALRPTMIASPLCNAEAFARKVEAAYRGMWQRWCEAPAR